MPGDGALYLIGVLFLIVLAALWFFLPFAVFGIQPKIEKVLIELKRTNELLEGLQTAFQTIAESARQPSGVSIIKCRQCGKEHSDSSAACPFCGHQRA